MENLELKLEQQLCFPLYVASKEIIREYRPFLEPIGLTYTQYITMLVLWEYKEMSVKEIGTYLYLDSGTLTPLLRKLEGQGLLKRRKTMNDERLVYIGLTSKGKKLKQYVTDIPDKISESFNLTKEEEIELYRLLQKVIHGKK